MHWCLLFVTEGDTLPTQCHPSSSDSRRSPPSVTTSKQPRATLPLPGLRPAERCRAGDAYSRDRFQPRPTRDLNKEKHRLQNIMATGKDLPKPPQGPPQRQVEELGEEDRDRFDECKCRGRDAGSSWGSGS
ncbi:hypothetical protein FKM82_018132 [Ascaphus truei]